MRVLSKNEKDAVARVFKRIAGYYGFSKDELLEQSRDQSLVRARQLAYFMLREYEGLSFSVIAFVMKRDRATVHHGVDEVKRRDLEPIAKRVYQEK